AVCEGVGRKGDRRRESRQRAGGCVDVAKISVQEFRLDRPFSAGQFYIGTAADHPARPVLGRRTLLERGGERIGEQARIARLQARVAAGQVYRAAAEIDTEA